MPQVVPPELKVHLLAEAQTRPDRKQHHQALGLGDFFGCVSYSRSALPIVTAGDTGALLLQPTNARGDADGSTSLSS